MLRPLEGSDNPADRGVVMQDLIAVLAAKVAARTGCFRLLFSFVLERMRVCGLVS